MERSRLPRLPLVADCDACAGLCCIALAFDRSVEFAMDKPAGVRCVHLTSAHRCAVHSRRHELGYSGCERYECLGAGQRATRLFDRGPSPDAAPANDVFDAFRVLREVHELLDLLAATEGLALEPSLVSARDALRAALERDDWTVETLRQFERLDEGAPVRAFLRRLGSAGVIGAPGPSAQAESSSIR